MLGSMRIAARAARGRAGLGAGAVRDRGPVPARGLYEQAYNLISDGAAACVVSRGAAGSGSSTAHQITNGGAGPGRRRRDRGHLLRLHPAPGDRDAGPRRPDRDDLDWVVTQNTQRQGLADPLPAAARSTTAGSGARRWPTSATSSRPTTSSTWALAAAGRVRPGDRIALVMAGFGLNWQCAVLEAVGA